MQFFTHGLFVGCFFFVCPQSCRPKCRKSCVRCTRRSARSCATFGPRSRPPRRSSARRPRAWSKRWPASTRCAREWPSVQIEIWFGLAASSMLNRKSAPSARNNVPTRTTFIQSCSASRIAFTACWELHSMPIRFSFRYCSFGSLLFLDDVSFRSKVKLSPFEQKLARESTESEAVLRPLRQQLDAAIRKHSQWMDRRVPPRPAAAPMWQRKKTRQKQKQNKRKREKNERNQYTSQSDPASRPVSSRTALEWPLGDEIICGRSFPAATVIGCRWTGSQPRSAFLLLFLVPLEGPCRTPPKKNQQRNPDRVLFFFHSDRLLRSTVFETESTSESVRDEGPIYQPFQLVWQLAQKRRYLDRKNSFTDSSMEKTSERYASRWEAWSGVLFRTDDDMGGTQRRVAFWLLRRPIERGTSNAGGHLVLFFSYFQLRIFQK